MKHLFASITMLALTACSAPQNSHSALAGEVSADNLWAGNVTSTMQRESIDPCYNPQDLMTGGDVRYTSWTRQRATFKNICFEVWMGGVTDNDGSDYAKLIDVQAHYRYEGEPNWRTNYVNALGRKGNNIRYAFNMGATDPFYVSTPKPGVPYRILSRHADSEGNVWVSAESLMEIYFTVNGKVLSKKDGWNFFVKYGEGSFRINQ